MNDSSFQTGEKDINDILENCFAPEKLNDHPWVKSPVVQEVISLYPQLRDSSPGKQLVFALAEVFRNLMPATPPRHGKRIDTKWGEFGLLAAQYFAPVLYGTPRPMTHREACELIDESILIFLMDKKNKIPLEKIDPKLYEITGKNAPLFSKSTLSDWRKRGVERLRAGFLDREMYLLDFNLTKVPNLFSVSSLDNSERGKNEKKGNAFRGFLNKRAVFILLLTFLLGTTLFSGYRIWEAYVIFQQTQENINNLKNFSITDLQSPLSVEKIGVEISPLGAGCLP